MLSANLLLGACLAYVASLFLVAFWADRRSRRIGLTSSGRAKLEAARPYWARAERHVRACLGPDDLAGLHAAMDVVLKKLGASAPQP